MFRKTMSPRGNRRNFAHGTYVKKINYAPKVMRGGIRL